MIIDFKIFHDKDIAEALGTDYTSVHLDDHSIDDYLELIKRHRVNKDERDDYLIAYVSIYLLQLKIKLEHCE